jgi:ABC-type nickel/cobalt efflux system permease component RcnA
LYCCGTIGTAITVACIATLAEGARGLAAQLAKVKPDPGIVFVRGLEAAAAVVIVTFGVLRLTCLYRKPKPEHSDDEARREWLVM